MKLLSLRVGISVLLVLFGIISVSFGQDELENLPDLEGKIAFVGDDFNIYTIDLTSGDIHQLSEGGKRSERFEFPTWSRDGQLAYFCCGVRGFGSPSLNIFVSHDGITAGDEVYQSPDARHVYAYWSPTTCGTKSDCADLAVLIQEFDKPELGVLLLNSANISGNGLILGYGAPFYYSWSSSGESLVLHRNNSKLEYYSIETANTDVIYEDGLGNFFAPGWSPVDERILYAGDVDKSLSSLMLLDDGKSVKLVDEVNGIIAFSWSPDGQYIAYRTLSSDGISAVYVIDANTGELVTRSNVTGIVAFFWSPDSEKIAYITLSTPPGSFNIDAELAGQVASLTQEAEGLAWNVLYIEDGSNQLYASFVPTFEMQYLLGYFDQFAQSHQVWSPDSTYIVYSERVGVDDRQSMITILNTDEPDAEPFPLIEGTFGVWSFD